MHRAFAIRRPTLTFVLSLMGFGLLSSPVVAESSKEARQWLEKMAAVFDQGAFTMDIAGTLDEPQIGKGTLKGEIAFGDASHQKVLLVISLTSPEGTTTGGASIQITTVQDGNAKWDEIEMVGLPPQVTRTPIGGGGGVLPDPISLLRQVSDSLDFEVAHVADGQVELTAPLSEAARANMGQLGAIPGIETFALVLAESDGRPLELRAVGDPSPIRMRFENLKFIDRKSLDASTFTYEPPEGVQVIDLAGGQTP